MHSAQEIGPPFEFPGAFQMFDLRRLHVDRMKAVYYFPAAQNLRDGYTVDCYGTVWYGVDHVCTRLGSPGLFVECARARSGAAQGRGSPPFIHVCLS